MGDTAQAVVATAARKTQQIHFMFIQSLPYSIFQNQPHADSHEVKRSGSIESDI